MKILGVTHPIPTKFAERIYKEDKSVFVNKRHLGKVSEGDKFIIYESRGAKAYTGWADIKSVRKVKTREIIKRYGRKLMITEDEFIEYSKGTQEMNIIEFKNFEKFNNPVVPKRFITVGGKYIYQNEYDMIIKKKD